ncbi:MAG: helix-turn-helix transcriptional regulator [Clostridia bacterium]|nr:helix-turn-helix transcriptional regulator [Clostridia bacterium]
MYDKNNVISLDTINEIRLGIFFYDTDANALPSKMESHSHGVYELYVNLSGEISFMVNNRIYPLQSGDIILSRPNEFHHAIIKESTTCRRFVLFFSGEGSSQIFENSLKNIGSHIVLPIEKKKRFITLCHNLIESDNSHFSRWYQVLELMHLLTYGSTNTIEYDQSVLPEDITATMYYIENNLSNNITVRSMAENAHVSINTLERHFKEFLNVSPKDCLKYKRLARACTMLSEGKNVQETCDICGFSDYSHFIATFKKEYGMTPLKFQKQIKN